MDEALKSERAFIEFVMSLPPKENIEHYHRSTDSASPRAKSSTPAGNTTKVGLDHLDNLCKLMEQLSELRDTNNKLQRRVQYLEDLKTLHDMHKEVSHLLMLTFVKNAHYWSFDRDSIKFFSDKTSSVLELCYSLESK